MGRDAVQLGRCVPNLALWISKTEGGNSWQSGWLFTKGQGRGMILAVSHRLLTTEARVRTQANQWGICSRQTDTGTGFSQSNVVFPSQHHSNSASFICDQRCVILAVDFIAEKRPKRLQSCKTSSWKLFSTIEGLWTALLVKSLSFTVALSATVWMPSEIQNLQWKRRLSEGPQIVHWSARHNGQQCCWCSSLYWLFWRILPSISVALYTFEMLNTVPVNSVSCHINIGVIDLQV